jgi:hypothetical protein
MKTNKSVLKNEESINSDRRNFIGKGLMKFTAKL